MNFFGICSLFLFWLLIPWIFLRNHFQRRLLFLVRRPGISLSWMIGYVILIFAIVNSRNGLPLPSSGDEQSILTGAEILSSLQLSNPSPQPAISFESPHLLVQPVYASKYQPGQSVFLGAAIKLGLPPIFGNWLLHLLWIPVLYWASRAVLGPVGSMIATFLGASHMMVLIYSQSYFSYGLPLLGGTVWFGSLFYFLKTKSPRYGFYASLGFACGWFSRPYETVVCLLLGILGGIYCWRKKEVGFSRENFWFCIYGGMGLFLTAISQMLYQYPITGSYFEMPYNLYEKYYVMHGPFFFSGAMDPRPEYHNPYFKFLYETWDESFNARRGFLFLLDQARSRALSMINLLSHPILLFFIPFAFTLYSKIKSSKRFTMDSDCRGKALARSYFPLLVFAAFGSLFFQFLPRWYFFHYSSSFLFLWIVLSATVIRFHTQSTLYRHPLIGRLSRVLRIIVGIVFLLTPVWVLHGLVAPPNSWWNQRHQLLQTLSQDGEKHLIFVRYEKDAFSNLASGNPPPWVANGGNIPGQQIIFAHDLDTETNQKVLQNYPHRKVWRLTVLAEDDYKLESW